MSPDGRWLAYVAWEDGAPRADAVPWPELTSKALLSAPDVPLAAAQITTDGVLFRSPDSRTIYYPDESGIVALGVDGSGDTMVLGERRRHLPLRNGDVVRALHPDGRRFLVQHSAMIEGGGDLAPQGGERGTPRAAYSRSDSSVSGIPRSRRNVGARSAPFGHSTVPVSGFRKARRK